MYSLLIVFALVSIVFSFLCSVWEAVLLSITPAFAEQKLQEGGFIGEKLQEFKKNVDRPLSAILTLNTVAHTLGAMGVGAQAAQIWGDSEPLFGLVSKEALMGAFMTLLILYASEIIPKTIGANNWRSLTPFTVRSLNFIIKLLFPLVWVSQFITKMLKKDKNKSVLSRADFTAMADLGEKEGVFKKSESKIIRNLLTFNSILAKDVMTPRTVVKASDESMTIRDFYEANRNLRFSRIPVFKDSKDHITGYFLKDHLLAALVEKKDNDPLSSIRRELLVAKDDFPIPELFNQFMEKKEHIALVVGEFGGMAGIVTMEDVIETLLGLEIVDELDGTENMQALARKQWEKRAKSLGLLEEETPPSER